MSTDDPEQVLAQAVAGRLTAGIPLMGGTLALTATRLVFVPLVSRVGLGTSNKAAKLSERAHRQLDQQWINPQRLLNAAISPLAVPVEIPLAQIHAVTPTRRSAMIVTWVDAGKPRRAEPPDSRQKSACPTVSAVGLYPPPSAVVNDVEPSERSRAFSTGYCFVP